MFESRGTEALVSLHAVSRSYYPGAHEFKALSGIDLLLRPGDFACLAGPSGSGKSTLLYLVGTLDQPSSGIIFFEGRDTSSLSPREGALLRRFATGFIFQTFNLIPVLTVYENVEYTLLLQGIRADERAGRVKEMLAKVGLEDLARRRVTDLSGGQQQRVAVARALIGRPRLLLADEPTGNLDSVNGEAIMALLSRLNKESGVTVLYSSHDPRIIALSSRIILLQDGKIVEDRETNVR